MYSDDIDKPIFPYYKGQTDFSGYPITAAQIPFSSVYHILYPICKANRNTFERVYDELLVFSKTFTGHRHFGFFPVCTFSHDDLDGPSMMEEPLLRYVKKWDRLGIRNRTIIVLYGDHGLRFNDNRDTYEGSKEDKMPMLWISLPEWLQTKYPALVDALKVNVNRVTSHYDLHHTLKHFIEIITGIENPVTTSSCVQCQSLLRGPLPEDRDCAAAAIESTFCICNANKTRGVNQEKVAVMKLAVEYMNNQIAENIVLGCQHIHSPVLNDGWTFEDGTIVLFFVTNLPNRAFEATLMRHDNGSVDVNWIYNTRTSHNMKTCGTYYISQFCVCFHSHDPETTYKYRITHVHTDSGETNTEGSNQINRGSQLAALSSLTVYVGFNWFI